MTRLPISFPDLVEILRACGPVRAADCNPKYVRATAMAQLTMSEPRLANRVRQFKDDQMQTLTDYILLGLQVAAVPAG
jgi:hypothetical protein